MRALPLLLVVLLCASACSARRSAKQLDALFKARERDCKRTSECAEHAQKDEALFSSCVMRCVSPNCFRIHFLEYELEEGEIDMRETKFKGCVIAELRESEARRKNGEAAQPAAG
eukprot:TRINITY_DN9134_c0_g1_i1.p1 TRINITY_DN9134_c0_g1~~TRINITY_DN9134_c0_g1_i1.p1  ORF type:complete len:123 (-),score=38.84 TRINITY_DN9134_c0_g1_i1:97-441(-)